MVEQTTKGAISPSTGRTLPDRYIEGTCPICGYGEARGDQCDNCGNQLDPTDLIDPRSKINGEIPEFIETQHFFLDLPALADALREWLEEREASGTWRPNVIKFSLNILDDIRPRAMTRDIDWGIPVPLDGWRDQPTKRLYVWFDAVIGYLSASVEWARRLGEPERWREWWNDPEALSYYFMGKDNITFHSQIWPAELLAYAGKGAYGGEPGEFGVLNLPTEVVSSEYLTMEGKPVLHLARPRHLRARRALALPARRAPLLHVRRRHRRARTPTSPGASSSAQQLRARRRLGQPRQPHGRRWSPRASARSRRPAELDRGRRGPAAPRSAPGSTASATSSGGTGFSQAIAEAMRVVGEVNKYVTDQAPFKLKGEDERERLAHGPARDRSGCRGPQHDPQPVPAALGQRGARHLRRRRRVHADAAGRGGGRPRRRAAPTR